MRSLALLLLVACGPADKDSDTDPVDTDPVDEACAPYTWSTVGEPFVRSWCSSCHGSALSTDQRQGAPDGTDFDTYADVQTWLARIELRTLEQGDMPPTGGPTEADLDALAAWIDCGAPE